MSRRRLFLSLGLLALAILIAIMSSFLYPHSREITVAIDRSVLDAPKKVDAPIGIKAEPDESVTSHSLALKPVPDPRLIEKTSLGLLPRIADNGDRPADIYARKIDLTRLQSPVPKLAMIILRSGTSETVTAEAYLALPPDVSFSVSAYARDAERQVRDIRNRGHEVFLEVQSTADMISKEDRGPFALDPRLDVDTNRERLLWMMSRFSGYAGVIADMTPKARQSDPVRKLVADDIVPRGLLFLGLVRPDSQSLAENREIDAQDRLSLLHVPGQRPMAIRAALDRAKAEFKPGGRYIIAIDPGPLAIGILKDWIASHQSNAFDLVPLSALMQNIEQM